MTADLIVAFLLIGFLAGALFCWPIARRSGELKAERKLWQIDPDDEEWWQL